MDEARNQMPPPSASPSPDLQARLKPLTNAKRHCQAPSDAYNIPCPCCQATAKLVTEALREAASSRPPSPSPQDGVAVRLLAAVKEFRRTSDVHDGYHLYNKYRVCVRCEESYCRAEKRLDAAIKIAEVELAAASAPLPRPHNGIVERDATFWRLAQWVEASAPSPQEAREAGDLGLTIDMLDADRLRQWADHLSNYGPDVSHWGSCVWVAQKMRAMADGIEQAVRDIGTLRQPACRCGVRAGVSHYCSALWGHAWVGGNAADRPLPGIQAEALMTNVPKGCPYHVPAYPGGCVDCADATSAAPSAPSPAGAPETKS